MKDELISISKEKLSNLFKAAHSAYQSDSKPPTTKSDEWVDWYVNYVVEKLGQPAAESGVAKEITTAKLKEPEPLTTARIPDSLIETPDQAKKAEPVAEKTAAPEAGQAAENSGSSGSEPEVPRKTEPDPGALQVCPTCAHRNRPGVLFCENCGTNLLTGQQSAAGTRDLRSNRRRRGRETGSQQRRPAPAPTLHLDESEKERLKPPGASEVHPRDVSAYRDRRRFHTRSLSSPNRKI